MISQLDPLEIIPVHVPEPPLTETVSAVALQSGLHVAATKTPALQVVTPETVKPVLQPYVQFSPSESFEEVHVPILPFVGSVSGLSHSVFKHVAELRTPCPVQFVLPEMENPELQSKVPI